MSFNDASLESLRPGVLFCDRYRIERHLADGGMNAVFLAIDEQSGLPVAVKVLFPHYCDNATVRARFLDEGRIQAMLNHPNIVHVYKVITSPILSFVMEYVEGDTLEEHLQASGTLSETEIVDLILPVMSAVGFAHNKGIIHRDLKPSNVILKKTAGFLEPKVMDFGVAKVSRGRQLTAAGTTVGTLHYMSPEQIVGASSIDGRADIYSLGCSLYKLCTGEVPFNASSEFALMMAQVEAPPTPPRELRADLSQDMQDIILKALSKEPEARFQTIREMTSALMTLSHPDAPRDTDTRPIPASLLEFAMAADEVAQDQTAQYRLSNLTQPAGPDETREVDALANMTHELTSLAVKRIESDRVKAAVRKSKSGIPIIISDPGLDTTRENLIDEMTTIPRPEADGDLRATIEASRDGFERRRAKLNDDIATQPVPRKTTGKLSRASRGQVALSRPGVDSQEVTSRHIPQAKLHSAAMGKPPAADDATIDERPSGRMDPLSPHQDPEDERDTSEQRPSKRVTSLPPPSPVQASPVQASPVQEDATVEERPSARLSAPPPAPLELSDDPSPVHEAGESLPLTDRIARNNEGQTLHNIEETQRGLNFLRASILLLVFAIFILLGVLLLR